VWGGSFLSLSIVQSFHFLNSFPSLSVYFTQQCTSVLICNPWLWKLCPEYIFKFCSLNPLFPSSKLSCLNTFQSRKLSPSGHQNMDLFPPLSITQSSSLSFIMQFTLYDQLLCNQNAALNPQLSCLSLFMSLLFGNLQLCFKSNCPTTVYLQGHEQSWSEAHIIRKKFFWNGSHQTHVIASGSLVFLFPSLNNFLTWMTIYNFFFSSNLRCGCLLYKAIRQFLIWQSISGNCIFFLSNFNIKTVYIHL
jgi:hypothetical protein